MTYTIITPVANTNTSYKNTGRLSFYKYEDIQVLAELFCQANACVVCDGKSDARGGMSQIPLYSTKWNYLGDEYWMLPNYADPKVRFLWSDRMTNMVYYF